MATLLPFGGIGIIAMPAAQAKEGSSYVCSGTFQAIPPGTYSSVRVTGICSIEGVVNVRGGLTIAAGGGLDASGPDCNSIVNVGGGVRVQEGGLLFFGNSEGTGCPSNSNGIIKGGVRARNPLAVVIHGTRIKDGVSISGGGGGTSCADVLVGGQDIGFPPFTDLEDNRIDDSVSVTGQNTCWMGIIRNVVDGSVRVNNNTMGDPDAIEIGLNHIEGTLACAGNALAFAGPGGVPTNSFDGSPPNPNVVQGAETGQCAGL